MIGHTFPLLLRRCGKIKDIVKSGDIGQIQYISSRRLNLGLYRRDINVAWDLAPHDISIILYIMEHSPISVNCRGNCHITPGIEDVTNMALTFPNNQLATVHNSWLDPRKVREMTIVGTRRMIVYDDVEPLEKIKIYDARVDRPPHYNTFAEFTYSYHYGDIYIPYVKQEEPLKVETQHFLDCINTGATPISNGQHGLELVKILEASSQSLKNQGAAVHLTEESNSHIRPRSSRFGRLANGNGNGNGRAQCKRDCEFSCPRGAHCMSDPGMFQRIAPSVKLGKDVKIFAFVNSLRMRDRGRDEDRDVC
jgi:hypothetical protein